MSSGFQERWSGLWVSFHLLLLLLGTLAHSCPRQDTSQQEHHHCFSDQEVRENRKAFAERCKGLTSWLRTRPG